MLKLEEGKRVTWRLSPDVHKKLNAVKRSTGLSIEEIGNLIILNVDINSQKSAFAEHLRGKKQQEKSKKKATDLVSNLPQDVLDKLANADPEQIAKILSGGD